MRICKILPITRQTLFFPATMPPEIQRLTNQFLHNPVEVQAAPPATTAASIIQKAVYAPSDDKEKRDALRRLLREYDNIKNAIVFANRKTTVAVLETSLKKHGFNASALHGDMDQFSRLKTLEAFRNGQITYLIASDVAARGLDIPQVSHVFNFDVPVHSEDYAPGRAHRAAGRVAAYTLVTFEEVRALRAIEQLIKRPVEWHGEVPAEDELADAMSAKGRRRDRPQRGAARSRGSRPQACSARSRRRVLHDAREKRPRSRAAASAAAEEGTAFRAAARARGRPRAGSGGLHRGQYAGLPASPSRPGRRGQQAAGKSTAHDPTA